MNEVYYINEVQHLGVILSNDMALGLNILIASLLKYGKRYVMRKLKFMLDRDSLNKIYISFVRSTLEYATIVWDNCKQYEIKMQLKEYKKWQPE